MLKIRDGKFESCYIKWKNNNFDGLYLAKLSNKIKGLETLMKLKGKLAEDASYYDDKLEERNKLLASISLICMLKFDYFEMKQLLYFIRSNGEISKYNLKIDENILPDFDLTNLGIYDTIIWNQIKKGILEGLMDDDIAILKASIKRDLESLELHQKRKMKEIEAEKVFLNSLAGIFSDIFTKGSSLLDSEEEQSNVRS